MTGFFTCAPRSPAPDGGGGAGRRASSGPKIDIHCHAHIQAAQLLTQDVIRPEDEPFLTFTNDASEKVNQEQVKTITPMLTSVERRLADMDAMGVDIQVVSPSPFQYCYWTEPDLGRQVAQTVNDGLAEIVAGTPDRFAALGTLPLQNPELALAELDRCVGDLGLKGIEISTNVAGTEVSRAGLDAVFARAEELDILIFMHPHGFTDGQRLSDHYFINIIGNPLDTTVAVSHLIFDGVLERYPGLKICLAHGGGYLGAYSARMDHAYHARADCRQCISHPPSSYLEKLYFDTMVFAPDQLRYLIDRFGSDHILMGTDYPFDMGEEDPLGLIEKTPGLSAEERTAIAGGNAARLLGLARAK